MTQPKIDHFEAVRGPANAPGTGPDDSIQVVTVDGRQYLQFSLKPGDVQPFDAGEGNAGANGKFNERAEVSLAPAQGTLKVQSPYNVREGMLQTYDLDYYFRSGFPNHVSANHEWAVIGQFHPQDVPAPDLGVPRFSGITCHDNEIHLGVRGSTDYFAKEPVRTGVRLPRRLVVKWSSKNDGYVKWVDRDANKLIGQYVGPTIPASEYQYILWGYYRAGGLPPGAVCIGGPNGPFIEITDGDLTIAAPVPVPPAPAGGVDVAKATAGLQALVDTRLQLEKVTLPQYDAAIASLQQRRAELQARRDQIAKVLDAGDWGGGVVAK